MRTARGPGNPLASAGLASPAPSRRGGIEVLPPRRRRPVCTPYLPALLLTSRRHQPGSTPGAENARSARLRGAKAPARGGARHFRHLDWLRFPQAHPFRPVKRRSPAHSGAQSEMAARPLPPGSADLPPPRLGGFVILKL